MDAVVAAVLHDWTPPVDRPVRVLDPACGDGRFLVAVDDALAARGLRASSCGIDIDPAAVDAARIALAGRDAEVCCADALDGVGGRFDLVVGNPPFLTPLAAGNERVARSSPVGSPYADAATQFLLLAWDLLDDRGRVGFVLPQSILANRDASTARRAIADGGALRWLWWSPDRLFDASVRTCAIVAERGSAPVAVRRQSGIEFAHAAAGGAVAEQWAALVSDLSGVPSIEGIETDGTVGARAACSAGFRDEFYGIAAAVADDADGPRLVTSGLIDPGRCSWGERPVRVAKRSYLRPRVDRSKLDERVDRWVRRQLAPKVLVASQTKVIEAIADPGGRLVPGVPVVSAIPAGGSAGEVWELAAVLTNPVTSAVLAHRAVGSGLSAGALRVSASAVAVLPWPAGALDAAVERLRADDVDGCAVAMLAAYGLSPSSGAGAELLAWWRASLPAVRG